MKKDDDQWKKDLTDQQYKILRQKGTEAPFSGELLNENHKGEYSCVACGNILFNSKAKYDSKTPGLIGWPSFSDVAKTSSVKLVDDPSLGMHRTEVICAKCGSHLGHVFDADDSSTGQHYCINSVCLDFKPSK